MKQESNNALLPPMEWEDFQQTPFYHLLFIWQQYRKAVYRFLHAASLKELEYVPNPESVPHTPYGQEDFDEICDFLQYNGMEEKDNALPSYIRLLSTNVGRFVVYQIISDQTFYKRPFRKKYCRSRAIAISRKALKLNQINACGIITSPVDEIVDSERVPENIVFRWRSK